MIQQLKKLHHSTTPSDLIPTSLVEQIEEEEDFVSSDNLEIIEKHHQVTMKLISEAEPESAKFKSARSRFIDEKEMLRNQIKSLKDQKEMTSFELTTADWMVAALMVTLSVLVGYWLLSNLSHEWKQLNMRHMNTINFD